jgi:hypothetical protein
MDAIQIFNNECKHNKYPPIIYKTNMGIIAVRMPFKNTNVNTSKITLKMP